MVKINLLFKAELVNVTDLRPESDDYDWHFKIKCNSCHEVDQNWITLNFTETSDVSGSRGEAHLVMRCKFCKRESSASFDESQKVRPYTIDDSGSFARLVTLDCRGLEPVEFEPRDGWVCKGAESNTPFQEIDLTDQEWADYDDKANDEVSIMEIEAKFEKA
ncbi:DUF866-domain-containing protein [Basidiobolus meristosporus CBS 931.73]|uniref:DUF866-domain-containing protein n=1 Tax=Basidiobolus meristosporus CBS 931.73 TaxID=1314790 RepID=A0A1Y1YSL7_9FUNG|nr:DUF866-domain-containing protein [Basidiobolus meristosporus CBS 931.73]|eukprot:ORY01020.1 DUF866-domain-containing protein [Basidiobolus meristosporus CBS 931.73]